MGAQGDRHNPHSLNLASGENVRELGGYPAEGGMTRTQRFLRSGSTTHLSRRDIFFLRRYGLERVVDLRGSEETRVRPDPFARRRSVAYLNMPLYDFDMHDPKLAHSSGDDDGLADYLIGGYLDILANKPAIRQVFSFMAQATPAGCVMFHCAAGMDRTGVTSMLVLGVAGVDRTHIVADYAYSYGDEEDVNLRVFGADAEAGARDVKLACSWGDIYDDALAVAPMVMGTVYDRLCDAYGGVAEYLGACGVTEREVEAIRQHLLA